MSRAFTLLLASLLLGPILGPGRAAAREAGRSAGTAAAGGSSTDRVARALEATLPRGLAAAQVLAPGLPAGEVTVAWLAPARPGWVSLLATVRVRGREVGRGWVRAEIKPLRRVLVAARALSVGEAIEVDATRIEERPVSAGEGFTGIGDSGGDALAHHAPSPLAGARVIRELAAGQVILESDVSRPAALARGTPVRVLVRRGAVTISAPATLERSARPGERTTARLSQLGRLVAGRLIDGNTLVEEDNNP